MNQTEDALKSLRQKTGIVSLKEGSAALTTEAAKTQEQLNAAEADLAEQQARVSQKAENGSKTWRKKKPEDDKAHAAGLQAKVETLKSRLRDVQQRTKQLSELGPQIEDLERKREMDETNYKYFAASLEKARIDEALDPSKMPNISAVQRPSPPALRQKNAIRFSWHSPGWRSLGHSARLAKRFGIEPDRWPAAAAGDTVTHSIDALDPVCERTLRVAS